MNKLWVEQYRPKTLSDVVFADNEQYKMFKQIIDDNSLPNLLFVGHQGTGKTSLSGVLINDLKLHPEDVLRINCSDDKIDKIRKDVKNFAFTMPIGSIKVVQLEEIDYLSLEAQALLRSLIEEVSESCRFIGTANYQNKIIPAIRDRFTVCAFKAPSKDGILLKVAEILLAENIDFDIDDLDKLLAISYPSIRKMIHLAEAGSRNGKLCLIDDSKNIDWKLNLLNHLENSDFSGARTLVCSNVQQEDLQQVFTFLYKNIHRTKIPEGDAIILIADYMYKHSFVADPEINIAALFIELSNLK